MSDPLSEVLSLVDARCVITGGIRGRGRWGLRFRPDVVKLEAVAEGACWVVVGDAAPVRLEAGDAFVLRGSEPVVLGSDPHVRPVDADDLRPTADGGVLELGHGEVGVTLVGGHVALDPAATGLFRAALPPLVHARASSPESHELRRLLDLIVQERADDLPGSGFAADQHAQLLLLRVLRAGLRDGELDHPGWLRLVTDPELRDAVERMHADPGRDWHLAELADAVGMSRSHFAHRFRAVAGQPPLTYLTHWRMRLAEHALRHSGATVAELAARLGYASESSFSHAFTRVSGTSPSGYRQAARAGRSGEDRARVAAVAEEAASPAPSPAAASPAPAAAAVSRAPVAP
jgi:AraC-like DNA-binding protein